jgi:streptomycin 6-kinase
MVLARLSSIAVITVPARYAAMISARSGDVGRRWLAGLSQMDDEERDEPLALRTWAADGAVRLFAHSPDELVLLLEKLDPYRSLRTEPIGSAVEIAGGLLRRLAVPAPAGLKVTLVNRAVALVDLLASRWQRLGKAFPRKLLDLALDYCAELGPRAANLLVDHDRTSRMCWRRQTNACALIAEFLAPGFARW